MRLVNKLRGARTPACRVATHGDATMLLCVLLATILSALALYAQGPAFRSASQLDEHYHKHGAEFGHISKAEYLHLAQQLRDAPSGGPILESRRADGEFSRFDKRHGYFGAYNPDRTIRTFFIPNDGERYFFRQARRSRP
jgi:pyocin large subunit-like protein